MTRAEAVLTGVGLGLAASAFALSAVLCAVARVVAPRLGFLDRPGGHKAHAAPTPLGGGVAVWLTTVAVPGLGLLAARAGGAWLPPEVARYADGVRYRGG